jgi:hypothetical protein
MQLDYLIAAETAFFSEEGRISIIKIFEKINLSGGDEKSTPPVINFSLTGKVTGDYGKGVRVTILDKNLKIVMQEVTVDAKELNKDFLNFIVIVNGVILENDGDYTATIRNYEGDLIVSENKRLFSVTRN